MQTQRECVRWIWIKVRPPYEIGKIEEMARNGQFETRNLRTRRSKVDPDSIDVEFRHFDRDTIELLKSCPCVLDAGEIPGGVEMEERQASVAA